jgi:hypothetical protein
MSNAYDPGVFYEMAVFTCSDGPPGHSARGIAVKGCWKVQMELTFSTFLTVRCFPRR